MLSKFTHIIKIKHNNYVAFNSLVFEPILLNYHEKKSLLKQKFENFTDNEIELLNSKGICIEDTDQDLIAEKTMQKYVTQCTERGISLIYIIPANSCNLACKYCFIGKLEENQKVFLQNDTADIIINNFYNHLLEKKIDKGTIVFYGGEPLMNFVVIKHIVEKCESQKKINWEFAIVTNSTLITEEIASFFKEHNFSVGVSVDGPKIINDKNRVFKNNNGSVYDIIIKKVELLKRFNVSIGLSITLTEEILHNKQFLKWISNLDIKDINYNLLHFTKKTRKWKNYYKKATKFLFYSNDILSTKNILDDRILRKIRAFSSKDFKYNDCGAIGTHQLSFAPNGDVTVCHGFWNSTKERCGNININTFQEIQSSDNFTKWKKNLTIFKSQCLKCPAIHICGGGCAMQSGDLFNGTENIDKAFCVHTIMSLKYLFKRIIK